MNSGGRSRGDEERLQSAIRFACDTNATVLDGQFMCRSLGSLNPHPGSVVEGSLSMEQALEVLREERSGALMVVGADGVLTGIFTERDVVRKLLPISAAKLSAPISQFMTQNPAAELPDISVAYALNLMSGGGFRHLPIVGPDRRPIGIFSVKDLIDAIVASYTEGLLNLPVG